MANALNDIIGSGGATPLMTPQKQLELLREGKRKTQVQKQVKVEPAKPVAVEKETAPTTEPKKTKLTKSEKTAFKHYLLDCFRPKEIEIGRLPRTLQVRKDVAQLEARLLSIVGGSGRKHKIADADGNTANFSVSLSAVYNYLLISFFQNNMAEIEQMEKELREQGFVEFN